MKPTISKLRLVLLASLVAAQASHAAAVGKDDAKYVTESAQGLMSELKLGAMAQERAGDARVKAFGQQMVTDHGKDMQALKALAAQKGVALPDDMNDEQRKEAAKLGKLSGAAFDREYLQFETKDHREDIKEHKKQARVTRDADLKKFASEELATVTAHKQHVDLLRAQIK